MKNFIEKTLHFGFLLIAMLSLTTIFVVAFEVHPLVGLTGSLALESVLYFVSKKLPKASLYSCTGVIAANCATNCTTPLQTGVEDRVWVINYADWRNATITRDGANSTTITNIVLPNPAFYWEGRNNSNKPTFSQIDQGGVEMYEHAIDVLLYNLKNVTKKMLKDMKGGRYVVVYENTYKDSTGESAFEVLGETAGLKITTLERDPNSTDTNGAWHVVFTTPKNKEPNVPSSIFDTNYADTLVLVESLLV